MGELQIQFLLLLDNFVMLAFFYLRLIGI